MTVAPSTPPIMPERFASPWAYLDAKQAQFDADRKRARTELKRIGWTLRPNHSVTGMWRALRWMSTEEGSVRISATTPDELIRLCSERFDKVKRKEAREKERAEKKKAKEKEREEKRAARRAAHERP